MEIRGSTPETGHRSAQPVRRFYFLDYFYIVLEACQYRTPVSVAFERFKLLKQRYALGESRYKVRQQDGESLTPYQEERYNYTFKQVVAEAEQYGLIKSMHRPEDLILTDKGNDMLEIYRIEGPVAFFERMFDVIESHSGVFRSLISFMYQRNKARPGLLIFPNYSPRLLGFSPSKLRTTRDVLAYTDSLVSKLREDCRRFLNLNEELRDRNNELLQKLYASKILSPDEGDPFEPQELNKLTKRIRDFWLNYFLKEVYRYESSMSSFETLVYRGKQAGVVQTTEFFPNFNGRLVYPTSVLASSSTNASFQPLFAYTDGITLFKHHPRWDQRGNQEQFLNVLVDSYFELRGTRGVFFVNLLALKELVCYTMKIADHVFEELLNEAYKMNLQGKLRIQISLEVDRLPEETKAMYLKQEPVVVEGKPRNIIGIDVLRGRSS